MDSTNIESIGVNAVCTFFERSRVVSTFISARDKEPCWDGNLYLYRADGKAKSNNNLIGRIATQVKGKEMKAFKIRNFTYPVDIVDLNQYRLDGGIIFFVVQFTDSDKMIFYKELTPVIISSTLKLHGKQKSVKLSFKPFPTDLAEAEQLLLELHANLIKQAPAITTGPLDFDQLRKLSPKGLSFVAARADKSKSPVELLTEKPIYLYAKFDNGMPDMPLGDGPCAVVASKEIQAEVSVGGTVYFNSYKNTISADYLTISVADCLSMYFPRNGGSAKISTKMSFDPRKYTLSEACNVLNFIYEFTESGSLRIGDRDMSFKVQGNKKLISEFRTVRKQYAALKAALDSLGVNEDLQLSMLTDADDRLAWYISDLCNPAVSDAGPLPKELKGVQKIKIANLILLLVFYEQDGAARVASIFDRSLGMQVKYCYPEGKLDESVFGVFEEADFAEISNMPYGDIVDSYRRLPAENTHVVENLNMVAQNMGAAYGTMPDGNSRKPLIADALTEIFDYLAKIDAPNRDRYLASCR